MEAVETERVIALAECVGLLRGDPRSFIGNEYLLGKLVYGWGNEMYCAEPHYLSAVIEEAMSGEGDILECGSGLTTLVLRLLSATTGRKVTTLESNQKWLDMTVDWLDRFDVGGVGLDLVGLIDYGEFWWYDPEAPEGKFSLVVCDGPSGGNRYGLLPVMGDWLSDRCLILLDDANRPEEEKVLEEWGEMDRAMTIEVDKTGRGTARVKLL